MPDMGSASVEAQGWVGTTADKPNFVSVEDILTAAAAYDDVPGIVEAFGGSGTQLPPWLNVSGVAQKCLASLTTSTGGGASMAEAIDEFNAMYV